MSENLSDPASAVAWFGDVFAGALLMAIMRGTGIERAVKLATTAWDLGIDSVEVTIQTPNGVLALREVARLVEERGKIVGAGTIVSTDRPDRDRGCRGRSLPRLARPRRAGGLSARAEVCRSCPESAPRAKCSSRRASASAG